MAANFELPQFELPEESRRWSKAGQGRLRKRRGNFRICNGLMAASRFRATELDLVREQKSPALAGLFVEMEMVHQSASIASAMRAMACW
ncbi:hypothetical protein DPM35_18620 [Mesorhizobium atlanticum]|uniref:Uncharacterized protein n=1 Tax=Mesorhizobium atlanticum TaxID=2233532 RepID=A0A330GYF1_9HYPH|nr:hypothetical protein DPM35_18620 [Mesorhizobium atlanticum]